MRISHSRKHIAQTLRGSPIHPDLTNVAPLSDIIYHILFGKSTEKLYSNFKYILNILFFITLFMHALQLLHIVLHPFFPQWIEKQQHRCRHQIYHTRKEGGQVVDPLRHLGCL